MRFLTENIELTENVIQLSMTMSSITQNQCIIMLILSVTLKNHYTTNQHTTLRNQCITLSSAEAELYACVKGSCESMGCKSYLADFNINVGGHILGDASAALGIIKRHGLGKLRHTDTAYLWLQQKAKGGCLKIAKPI